MEILFLNQFFYPDTAATAQLLTDLVDSLPGHHTATVICSSTKYVEPPAPPAPSLPAVPVDDLLPSTRVLRLKNRHFGRSKYQRVRSYISFLRRAYWNALQQRPDVVVSMTTPPFLSLAGMLLQKLKGSRHYIWEMDLYPELVADLGFLKPFPGANWFLATLARYIRRNADGIFALGECMKERLVAAGIPGEKIHVCENWADPEVVRAEHFPPTTSLIVHYSGNFGLVHDYTTICQVVGDAIDDANIRFTFSGAGRHHAELSAWCQRHSLHNVQFRNYVPISDLSHSLADGHIGLVLQRRDCVGDVVPSKTYGIMAAGRPILFIGPKASEPARIIERYQCGWRFEPGDSAGVLALLRHLTRNRHEVVEAGRNARRAFEQNYTKQHGVTRIFSVLGIAEPVGAERELGSIAATAAANS